MNLDIGRSGEMKYRLFCAYILIAILSNCRPTLKKSVLDPSLFSGFLISNTIDFATPAIPQGISIKSDASGVNTMLVVTKDDTQFNSKGFFVVGREGGGFTSTRYFHRNCFTDSANLNFSNPNSRVSLCSSKGTDFDSGRASILYTFAFNFLLSEASNGPQNQTFSAVSSSLSSNPFIPFSISATESPTLGIAARDTEIGSFVRNGNVIGFLSRDSSQNQSTVLKYYESTNEGSSFTTIPLLGSMNNANCLDLTVIDNTIACGIQFFRSGASWQTITIQGFTLGFNTNIYNLGKINNTYYFGTLNRNNLANPFTFFNSTGGSYASGSVSYTQFSTGFSGSNNLSSFGNNLSFRFYSRFQSLPNGNLVVLGGVFLGGGSGGPGVIAPLIFVGRSNFAVVSIALPLGSGQTVSEILGGGYFNGKYYLLVSVFQNANNANSGRQSLSNVLFETSDLTNFSNFTVSRLSFVNNSMGL